MEREDQDAALALDHERCKVVLSTNIAESSVTLPDVTHVIDAGLSNYAVYNPKRWGGPDVVPFRSVPFKRTPLPPR